MPISATPPPPPPLTADLVKRVMAEQQAHCAPTTWDKVVRSLRANGFPYPVQ